MMIEKKKKKSACLQFSPRPECYNKLLLSSAREGEGRPGEEAGAKRPQNLKDGVGTPAASASAPRGGGGRAGAEEHPARVNAGGERAAEAGRAGSGRAGAGRCPFKAGGAGRPSAAVIGAAGSLAPRARPGGVGWSRLRFDKVLATQ